MNVKRSVAVTITSDLMCPWCFIGLKLLQEGARSVDIEPVITWKPFILRPDIPLERQMKGGTPSSRVGSHLARQGKAVGIEFTGLTDRTPNTALFHATIKYLQDEIKLSAEKVTEFHMDVFEAYFTLAIFPGEQEGILKNIGDQSTRRHVQNLFADTDRLARLTEEVRREAMEASLRGISGVPTFSFENDGPAFSGAQPAEKFAYVLEQYANTQTASSTS